MPPGDWVTFSTQELVVRLDCYIYWFSLFDKFLVFWLFFVFLVFLGNIKKLLVLSLFLVFWCYAAKEQREGQSQAFEIREALVLNRLKS